MFFVRSRETRRQMTCSFIGNISLYWSRFTSVSTKICKMVFPLTNVSHVICTQSHKVCSFQAIHIYSCAKTPGVRVCYESTVLQLEMCVEKLIHCLLTLLKNHHVKYSTQLSDKPRVIHMVPLHDSKDRVVCAVSANSIIDLIYFSAIVISEKCLGQILAPFLKCK